MKNKDKSFNRGRKLRNETISYFFQQLRFSEKNYQAKSVN